MGLGRGGDWRGRIALPPRLLHLWPNSGVILLNAPTLRLVPKLMDDRTTHSCSTGTRPPVNLT